MLVRFFRTKEYAEQFLSGKIYCNPLSYFQTYIKDEETAKLAENKITDVLEGSMQMTKECFPFAMFKEYLSSDSYIVFPEYSKSHICCFSNNRKGNYPNNMEAFGPYCVAVYNFPKFAKYIKKAVMKNNSLYYLTGGVNYYCPTRNLVPVNHKSLILMSLEGYRVLYKDNSAAFIYKDVFNKIDRYSEQNEWRLFLYKENWNTDSFILDTGDLSDCCKMIKPEYAEIDKCINDYQQSEAATKIKGNINRDKLNKMIINKDPWGKIHFTIGSTVEPEKEIGKIIKQISPNYIKETGEPKRAVIRLLLEKY